MNIAERIIFSPQEEATVNRWSQGKSFPLRLIQRAQIIQLAAQGIFNHDIAKRLNVSRPTVQLWRERFLALRLSGLEKDAPRPGRFPKIHQKKVTAIVNATLQTTPSNAT
ncbi:MAG: helix-turn-helix domain-containing protein, partial [Nitrospirae bacterium]|nr:helix-turn-helix domain-containing protein [Nitrospirota bacterium]